VFAAGRTAPGAFPTKTLATLRRGVRCGRRRDWNSSLSHPGCSALEKTIGGSCPQCRCEGYTEADADRGVMVRMPDPRALSRHLNSLA
jgi:hypothetical protein